LENAVHNAEIAALLSQAAELLELDEANQFRVRAYQNAANTISQMSRSVEDMVKAGEDLTDIYGIGEDLAGKLNEMVTTGRMEMLDELKNRIPLGLLDLTRVPGLGAKRVKRLHNELNISNRQELAEAASAGKIRSLKGFGAKFEAELIKNLERMGDDEKRLRIDEAKSNADALVAYLHKAPQIERIEVAGSYRRRRDSVGDLDILVTSLDGDAVIDYFVKYSGITEIESQGDKRATVILYSGLQVDLRVVPPESYGAALLYFTGSKPHNLALRNRAIDQGLKVNEYGVFRDEERIAGATEEEIYQLFAMPWITPELREDRGELDAAFEHHLPNLITVKDIRGQLHSHSTHSDGRASIEEMARAAQERGLDYLAITDHSPLVTVVKGVDANELAQEIDEIDRINATLNGFTLLKGIEVDIRLDGTLDLPDTILSRLDIRVASVHSHFNLTETEQTERIIRALDNPYVNILAHPTGRLIGKRPPYEVDIERVMRAALERGCYLELNSNPQRLDLHDLHCKMAKDMGLKLSIATDAHRPTDLDFLSYGVDQGRRGWLEPEDVLNTRSLADLRALLKRP
jgi:DNA polymerase (family 10)